MKDGKKIRIRKTLQGWRLCLPSCRHRSSSTVVTYPTWEEALSVARSAPRWCGEGTF